MTNPTQLGINSPMRRLTARQRPALSAFNPKSRSWLELHRLPQHNDTLHTFVTGSTADHGDRGTEWNQINCMTGAAPRSSFF
jgi:hypothetical protein